MLYYMWKNFRFEKIVENAIIFTYKYCPDKNKFRDMQIHNVQIGDFYFIWSARNSTYTIIDTGRHISTSRSFWGELIKHPVNLLHIPYMHGLKLALLPWHQSGLEYAPSVQSVLILMKKTLNTIFWNDFCFENVLWVVCSLKRNYFEVLHSQTLDTEKSLEV